MVAGLPDAIEPLISGLTLDERIAWGMSAAGDSLEVNIHLLSFSNDLQVSIRKQQINFIPRGCLLGSITSEFLSSIMCLALSQFRKVFT